MQFLKFEAQCCSVLSRVLMCISQKRNDIKTIQTPSPPAESRIMRVLRLTYFTVCDVND